MKPYIYKAIADGFKQGLFDAMLMVLFAMPLVVMFAILMYFFGGKW